MTNKAAVTPGAAKRRSSASCCKRRLPACLWHHDPCCLNTALHLLPDDPITPAPLPEDRIRHRVCRGQAARHTAIRAAWASGHYMLREIGEHFGLHHAAIIRIAREAAS